MLRGSTPSGNSMDEEQIIKDSFFLFLKGNNLTADERLELEGRGWEEKIAKDGSIKWIHTPKGTMIL